MKVDISGSLKRTSDIMVKIQIQYSGRCISLLGRRKALVTFAFIQRESLLCLWWFQCKHGRSFFSSFGCAFLRFITKTGRVTPKSALPLTLTNRFTAAFVLTQSEPGTPVDPLPRIRAECLTKCPKDKANYDACVERITKSGEGDCEAWFFDLTKCIDKCAAPKIFQLTKE